MIGRVIGNRYELQERIGGGGMAIVYRAHDHLLDRPVAVKILRPDYDGKGDFVRRFRREAQAAASLSHENVVAILDVGQEEETYYIVMELVDGRDLRTKLQEQGPLSVEAAVQLAVEILEGLEHAHQNGIIHRDIKPSNIMVTRSGQVKVADFGIARATSEGTMTHTGSILGSAHYFSPEQAKGAMTYAQSDLYSLGVVLYELVTGQVPFQGDSPISVALKHVQEIPRPPYLLNDQVPLELAAIIGRALEKDPAARYQTAREMQADLQAFLGDFLAGRVSYAAGGEFPTQRISLPRPHQKPRRRFPAWAMALVGLVAVVLMAVGVGWAASTLLYVPDVAVPAVEGKTLAEATQALAAAGLSVGDVKYESSPSVVKDLVIKQDRAPETTTKRGNKVDLVVSQGPRTFAMPNLVGLPDTDAKDELRRLNLNLGRVVEQYDTKVEAGRVLSTSPVKDTEVTEGQIIDLVISQGPRYLPNLVGRSRTEAEQLLKEGGFLKDTEFAEVDSTAPKGQVVLQTPSGDVAWTPGTKIRVEVSKGLEKLSEQTTTLTITVSGSPGDPPVTVQLRVTDATRRDQVIYEKKHPPGDRFNFDLKWTGSIGEVQVLVNGIVTDRRSLVP